MNRYVLDTNTLTLYQRGNESVTRCAQAHSLVELATAIISVEEQLGGWYAELRRFKKRDQLAAVYLRMTQAVRFLSRFEILTFSESAMARYEGLRKEYRRIGKSDLRIAAIVLENDDIIVSANVRDLGQIKGLRLEDWTK